MAAIQVASMPPVQPPSMNAELGFVMKECHCDVYRARQLLQLCNNNPFKAAKHQQKLTAMLAHRGHSRAQPKSWISTLTPPSGGPSSASRQQNSDMASPSSAPNGIASPPNPAAPMTGLSPARAADLSTLTISATPMIIGLAEPLPETHVITYPDTGDTAKPQQEWDFRLPLLPESDASDILITAGYTDHIGEQGTIQGGGGGGKFNPRKISAALQHGADLPTILRYLQSFPSTAIKDQINNAIEGFASIFYAVETNNSAILRLWASYGANVCTVHPASGTPLIAYAIALSEQLDGRDTSTMVTTLLSFGASPKSIPDSFYQGYNRDLSEDELLLHIDGVDKGNGNDSPEVNKDWQWCMSPAARRKLARTTSLSHRYYLERATKLKRAGIRYRQVAALRNAEALLGIPYHLIGQTVAANHLLRKLMTYITVPSNKPLVLVFAGPSGHGKTEMARRLGDLMGLELQVVDCTIFNNERELFGPRAPYVGSERGSPLNNFISQNTRRRSIVFLDEFEKTSKEIHQSLLLPFDNGEYQDRRSLMTVDCSRTIWILATNALDETILQFCDANPAILQQNSGDSSGYAGSDDTVALRLGKKLSSNLRAAFLDRFGAPVTGRVSGFVPFLPFSRGEQAVVTHKFLMELVTHAAAPVRLQKGVEEQLLGNVRLHIRHDASLCNKLAQGEYSEELGARSLHKAVDDVRDLLVESYLGEEDEIEESENIEKADFVVDIRADDVVVRKAK